MKRNLLLLISSIFLVAGCGPKWTETTDDGFNIVKNEDGRTLAYNPASGVKILTINRLAFKDMNKDGTLDRYEDWRLTADERAKDLASKLTVEEIAGLMLYSSHQSIPAGSSGFFRGSTYNGKPFEESGANPSDLSDQQKKFLTEDHLRHVLITTVESPVISAKWNNNAQSLAESLGKGIPVNISSDPRHGIDYTAEFNLGSGGKISMWPNTLGIAATFDPGLMNQFGKIAATEYRALGITTALSPQIDLATEPRWSRFNGTMGEDPYLAADMARAYVDGFQTSDSTWHLEGGWGYRSVNAMVKHWPGGGPEEGGRDGHFGYGAYAVYPGNNFGDHLIPFTEGAFKLEGKTSMATAVMPYYTVSWGIDTVNDENVANGYNKFILTNLLRGKYGYDGVICSDWGITGDVEGLWQFQGKPWGVEKLTVAERHYRAILAGLDQFGGNNDKNPVIEAYNMGVKDSGEVYMRKRFEESAVRLLKNIFRTGLFENPYLNSEKTGEIVGNPEFMKAGYDAQLKSVVMLKNKSNSLPVKQGLKVYIPKRFIAGGRNWFGMEMPEKWIDPMKLSSVEKYFTVVSDPADADIALVLVDSPVPGTGYDPADAAKGGTGYIPISLQYGKYTAVNSRVPSIAGGSPFENFTDRSYRGKSATVRNEYDMKLVKETRKKIGNKPLILIVNTTNPFVISELENSCDAILIQFGVQDQALLDIVTGASEPSALLPFQLPADMLTVEEQFEDVPRDMKCYTDSQGNTYDFAFGLNWSGVIKDNRADRYKSK